MPKKRSTQQPLYGKRDWLDSRTHEEDPAPLTDEEVRRELGFDLLPFNGGDREVQD